MDWSNTRSPIVLGVGAVLAAAMVLIGLILVQQSQGEGSTLVFPTIPAPAPLAPGEADGTGCTANSSGQADLAVDLVSLHYDHAPDRDDGHATVAAKEVATRLEFTPWVVSGAYGVRNDHLYDEDSEPVMDATWGDDWIDAHGDWDTAVQLSADRWQQVLADCGDVWIAEGGQADFTADVVRELITRMPGLSTRSRIHAVQHSNWNETMSNHVDLAFTQRTTDYQKIPDGNRGDNGTAGLDTRRYEGAFIDDALEGENGSAWTAAFDYYPPRTRRLDFSDTVELLYIVGIDTNQINDAEQFADEFIR